jgi:hypothetical protein
MTPLRLERCHGEHRLDLGALEVLIGLRARTIACAAHLIVQHELRRAKEVDLTALLHALGISPQSIPPCGIYGSLAEARMERQCEQASPAQIEVLTAVVMERLREVLPEDVFEALTFHEELV